MSTFIDEAKPIRVVLAEDNLLVREGMQRLLETVPALRLVKSCANCDDLMVAIAEFTPDVVVTDIRMPPGNRDEGFQVAAYCRREFPQMGVVLLSQFTDAAYLRALLADGAEGRGYLLKERVSDVDDLVLCIQEVARGGSVIDPKVIESLVTVRPGDDKSELDRLTRREVEVLAAMAEGKNNAAIASELILSQRAVEKHINSIFSKLGLSVDYAAHPRVSAVLLYLSQRTNDGG